MGPVHQVDIIHGELQVHTKLKSTFQAHVARVSSIHQVNWAHTQLLCEKKVATATHNASAYRLRDAAGNLLAGQEDDYMPGAGSRLAALLEGCGEHGVFVMVSWWLFGGVELGPQRFRQLSDAGEKLLKSEGLLPGPGPPLQRKHSGGGGRR